MTLWHYAIHLFSGRSSSLCGATTPGCNALRLLLLAFLTFHSTCGRAQNDSSRGLQTALNRAFEKGNLMVALAAVDWRPGLAIAATALPPGATKTLELTLRKNTNYTFLATADREFTDVDLYLRDSLGSIIAQDNERDGTPIVEFQVPVTGNYQVQLHLAAAELTDNYVALSLLQSGGPSIIEGDYRRLSNRFFTASTALLQATDGLDWSGVPGSWSIVGFTAQAATPLELSNLLLPQGKYQIAASADLNFRNLSLYLADGKGQIVGQSATKSPFPLLTFQVPQVQSYQLRIVPKKSKAAGLLLLGVFQH